MLVLALPLYVEGRARLRVGRRSGSRWALRASPRSSSRSFPGRLGDRHGRRPLLVVGRARDVRLLPRARAPAGPRGRRRDPTRRGGCRGDVRGRRSTRPSMDIAPEERRGEAVSLVTLASYLGLTFGPVLADLLRGSDRYPLVWLVTAALVLAATALVATLPRDETGDRGGRCREAGSPPRGALRPGLLVLLGLLGFGGFVAFAAHLRARSRDRTAGPDLRALRRRDLARTLLRPAAPGRARARSARSSSRSSASPPGLALIGAWQTTTGLHRRARSSSPSGRR